MKFITCIVFALTTTSFAQHPQDLVSPDALAVLSIKDAGAIQSSLKAISSTQGGVPVDDLLSQFIKNPSAIDYSKGVLLSIEPGVIAEGQRPAGMLGAMPHLVVICKPKQGKTIQLNSFSGVNTSTMLDGWFIAAGGNSWSPPEGGKISPIFAQLPDSQVSLHVLFGKLWSQIGPITQMAGGMMIGQLNKPGPTGMIDPEQRKQTAAISQAFRKVMQFCAGVDTISAGASLNGGSLGMDFMIAQKNPSPLDVDNSSMLDMSTSMKGGALQYAMSGEFTKMLLDYQLSSMGNNLTEFPMIAITDGMRELADLQGDNVVMYDLDAEDGLTIFALAETSDATAYLSKVNSMMDNMTQQFADEFQMKLTPTDEPTTWKVDMIGDDAEDLKVMNAVVPADTIISFGELGGWVGFVFGSRKVLPSVETKGGTNLSRLISAHEDVSIEFAMSMDARKFASAFMAIAEAAGTDDGSKTIASGPSAITEAVLGTDETGFKLTIKMDLAGLSKLVKEMD
ncbi:MAG: hypothetical protein H8E91_00865 [Planctomycetes bacterium]|nr:hypothetical protein [Planctomycetota bacterium]